MQKQGEGQGQPVLGIVHVPMTGETYYAERGKGAWMKYKDKTVRLSVRSVPLSSSLLGYCHMKSEIDKVIKLYNIIKPRVRDFRKFGAGALELALVASGRLQGFMVVKARPWDVAAGILLVEEAGGKTTDFKGNPFPLFEHSDLLSAPPDIHEELLGIIKDV